MTKDAGALRLKVFTREAVLVGEQAKRGLKVAMEERLHRLHWLVLWAGIAASWVLDIVVNTVFHAMTIAGHLIDSALGPIDEMLIAIVPLVFGKELLRRSWNWLTRFGWAKRADVYLFGGDAVADTD